ncbi:hypothetical protein [Glycomyces harbinensis]|uniref:LPXTG-motif cell wall anchor domain-containing protein n=1 Tax=Glycomyces harbinensis TaxID=58114 RepID=A0A1G6SKI7_9ACTN|nr:hypothetical protein [Glycomyces harbinensis]SDD17450.1 hypothetical protein SAMN05216270_102154 [Glycomyces harbinensis]
MNEATGRRLRLIGAVSAVLLATASPARAQDDEAGYATWTFTGVSRAYTGTMTLPGNFPEATFTSDARADSGLRSGANTWLGPAAGFGAVFGSSQDQGYPLIRPRTDTPGNASSTTYTFEDPTPSSGWGFALGDIDADTVTITATGADGSALPASALGYQGSFNFCDTSPKPSACSGVTNFHTPTWTTTEQNGGSGTLSGDGVDETGGTGWFQPTAPISTLTFSFSALSGFPVYQTWFAKLAIPDPDPSPSDDPSDGPSDDPSDGPGGDPTADPAMPVGNEDPSGDGPLGLPTLPITGAPLLTAILGGLAAIGVGALIMAAMRRRRAES